jgi:hypothetical protein
MTVTTKVGSVRQHPRQSQLSDVCITYEGSSENIIVRPPDISLRGMFINKAKNFPQGAILKLSFRLNQSGYKIRTRCEVRYCLPDVGIGVEFV